MDEWVDPSDEELAASLAVWKPIERHRESTEPRVVAAHYDAANDLVVLKLRSGAIFSFPPSGLEGLAGASADALAAVQIFSEGEAIGWPSLDVDSHVPGLILALSGSPAWQKRLFQAEWEALQAAFPAVAAEMGRQGGAAKTPAKAKAARENGKKGGRPRKAIAEPTTAPIVKRPKSGPKHHDSPE